MAFLHIAWGFLTKHLTWVLLGLLGASLLAGGLSIRSCVKQTGDLKATVAVQDAALAIAGETAAAERKARREAEDREAKLNQDFSKFRDDAARNKQTIRAIPAIPETAAAYREVNAQFNRLFHEFETIFTGS